MLHDVQMAVCAQLFKDVFPLGSDTIDNANEDAPDRWIDEIVTRYSGQFIRALRQPAVLGRVAGTCKTLHTAVQKYRTAKLLDAVESINTYPTLMVLYFHESDMLRESSLRFKVMLGSRDMYDVVFMRRRSETAGEADVPQELFAQSVIQTHDDKPTWTSLERRYAFHELCFVKYSSLQSEEQEQHRL